MHKPSKFLELLFNYYPAIQLVVIIMLLYQCMTKPKLILILVILFFVYGLSPLLSRLLMTKYGAIPTTSYVGKNIETGNLWLMIYKLQYLYNSLPMLESLLKFFPGLYSFWLRLWGSKIGKKINWAPTTTIVDRTNLNLGDRLLVGNNTYITSHVLKKSGNKYFLFFKSVEIGDDSFISFSCTLGPGLVLPKQSFLKAFSVQYNSPSSVSLDVTNVDRKDKEHE